MADVSSQRPEYIEALPIWSMVNDAAEGEHAVKAKGEKYLPKPNAHDHSPANTERYNGYVARSVYYNATGRTLSALVGMAFEKSPAVEIPAGIAYALEDVTGTGLSLVQQSQATLAEVLKAGRCGLLADYPTTSGDVSLAEVQAGTARATLTLYRAEDVTNWQTEQRGAKAVLTLVVLSERYEVKDGFEVTNGQQYRVLRLADRYTVEIWRKVKNPSTGKEEWTLVEQYEPTFGNGVAIGEIPFTFVGAANNDWRVDRAPLQDLAVLNLAHYRNSADYEDSVFFCGQPQFWIAGLTEEWRDHLEKNGVYVGSRSILPLPINGSAGILQASPNTLAREAMQDKEAQMAALGARLLTVGGVAKTATQTESEDTSAHSVLSLACDNVSSAYRAALGWVAMFANASGDVAYEIPTQFARRKVDPAELSALIALVQGGHMPKADLWHRLRTLGLIDADKSDDDLREEIDAELPEGVDLEGNPLPGEGGDPAAPGDASATAEPIDLSAVVEAINALSASLSAREPAPAAPQAPQAITINMPEQQPANVTVNTPDVNVASPTVNVAAPTVNVSPPSVTVEAPTVNVQPPDVSVPVNVTVEKGSGNKSGSVKKQADGSYKFESKEGE